MAICNPVNLILKNNKNIIVRNLESIDAEQYFDFSERISIETKFTLHFSGQFKNHEPLKERWATAKNSPFQIELGGFDQGLLISHLSLYKPFPFHPYEKHNVEFCVRILKDYSSKGLGFQKMYLMENIARKMEAKRIQARVRASNYIGITLYQKLGYEIEGMRKNAVCINGTYENEFYIAKYLD